MSCGVVPAPVSGLLGRGVVALFPAFSLLSSLCDRQDIISLIAMYEMIVA